MFNIEYHYIDRKVEIDEDKCSKWLNNIAKDEQSEIHEVNFVFCSDDYLLKINKEHLERDYFTDVISFYYNDEPGEIYGDVFLSIDRIKDNANQYGNAYLDELHRILVHGFLHLVGYTDNTDHEKTNMAKLENEYLAKR